ncbi:MAG TPA: hypothetical protein VJI70_01765 [Candidatus Paceibacterota bacterium]
MDGLGEWEKQKKTLDKSPDFHLGEVVDPVQELIDRVGWERAIIEIESELDEKPDDQETRRRATLIIKLNEERMEKLKGKLQH